VWDSVIEITIAWSVWIATACLVFLGLVGTVVPFLPGHLLIFAGALVPYFSLHDHGGLEWWGLLALGIGLVLAQVLEYLSGAMGSRWFGGTKWGAFGAFAGGIVGLFFMPFGLLLGPLLGAAGCEWLFAEKTVKPATVSGVGSVIGTVSGLVLKIVVAILMVVVFAIDLFWL